jgi:hypothetical protein
MAGAVGTVINGSLLEIAEVVVAPGLAEGDIVLVTGVAAGVPVSLRVLPPPFRNQSVSSVI